MRLRKKLGRRSSDGHSFSIVDFIINQRKGIEIFFLVLAIINVFCYALVGVNYDMTKYLPELQGPKWTAGAQKGIRVPRHGAGHG